MFINIRAPLLLAYGSGGGPTFRTEIVEVDSGEEQRNQAWAYPRGEYEFVYNNKLQVFYGDMFKFMKIVHGSADSFRARDPLDCEAAIGEGIFIDSDGSPTGKQMLKREALEGLDGEIYYAYTLVTKPVEGEITLDDGTGDIDYDTGIVYNCTATAWHGLYDKHVRFNTDRIKPTIEAKHAGRRGQYIVSFEPIPLIEVREDDAIDSSGDPYPGTGGLDPI